VDTGQAGWVAAALPIARSSQDAREVRFVAIKVPIDYRFGLLAERPNEKVKIYYRR